MRQRLEKTQEKFSIPRMRLEKDNEFNFVNVAAPPTTHPPAYTPTHTTTPIQIIVRVKLHKTVTRKVRGCGRFNDAASHNNRQRLVLIMCLTPCMEPITVVPN